MTTQGACPSCGAPVEFTAGTALVVVCAYCQTVVARQGLNLEAHGKIGRIVETDSPLRLGADGRYERVGYRLVGHLQKDHGAGPWDEWYVEFDDGRTGWLSESEGAFHLLFEAGDAPGLSLDELTPGHRFTLRHHRVAVEERGYGRVVAAEGQLPNDVDPTADSHYVDVTGPKGFFATLDFGTGTDNPQVFTGKRLKLEELGISPDQLKPRVKKVGLQQARCTQCNGALELRAPDQTKRVACPFCGALLDVRQGKLAFLQLLEKPEHAPLIPFGTRGKLDGTEWMCIGFLVRSCTVEGVRYPWEEYLLYNAARGFTWLMYSNGHWVFLKPQDAGEVAVAPGVSAHLDGRRYKAFQNVLAVTETVLGEFYWEVRSGETALAEEYVAPPYSVNVDRTDNEVSYTLGEYLEPQRVKEAFNLKEELPAPRGIAPSQPNPHAVRASTWVWTGIWAAALLAIFMLVNARASKELVLNQVVAIPADAVPGTAAAMHFSEPFELKKRGNMKADLLSSVSNTWLGVQGDLVNETTGDVVSFYEEVGYYSGRDSDGSWSEGSTRASDYLSAVPPGRYVLRTTAFFDGSAANRSYQVALTSDTPRGTWFFCALVLLLIGPLLQRMRASGFESSRWAESNLGSSYD